MAKVHVVISIKEIDIHNCYRVQPEVVVYI